MNPFPCYKLAGQSIDEGLKWKVANLFKSCVFFIEREWNPTLSQQGDLAGGFFNAGRDVPPHAAPQSNPAETIYDNLGCWDQKVNFGAIWPKRGSAARNVCPKVTFALFKYADTVPEM